MHPLIERLLETGSLHGPYRRTRPMTLTRRMRFMRWLRATFGIRKRT